ncbi:hypothetical protein TNCV_3134011 [Trichonephila clavipes]|nr:hypothetical protein TNCV_3134011 [Trichonephila clavipes]
MCLLVSSTSTDRDSKLRSGCGNLVVKVTDSWQAFNEFETNINEDSQCRGGQFTLNTLRHKCLPVAVVWKQVGQIGESLVIWVEAMRPLEDSGKNWWAVADFSVMTVAVDLGPQQIGRTY